MRFLRFIVLGGTIAVIVPACGDVANEPGKPDADPTRSARDASKFDAAACGENLDSALPTILPCAPSFDLSAPCSIVGCTCSTVECTACSENAYDLDTEIWVCTGGRWMSENDGVGDCGNGSGGAGAPGYYADAKCTSMWLPDGGVGPASRDAGAPVMSGSAG